MHNLILNVIAVAIVLIIGVLIMFAYSRGRGKDESEIIGENNGKICQMHPDDEDPEHSIGKENYPSWKSVQNN